MRVLVAIDGSEPAGIALDLVTEAAWPVGTEILVAEAVESGAGLFGGPWPALAMVQADTLEAELRGSPELMPIYLDAVAASRKHHDQLAREMTTELQAAGLRAEADRREGDAATEILAAASGSNTDLRWEPMVGPASLASSWAVSPAMSSSTQRARFSSSLRALHRPNESGWCPPMSVCPGFRSHRNGAAASSSMAGRTRVRKRTASATSRAARTSSSSIGHTLPGRGSDL